MLRIGLVGSLALSGLILTADAAHAVEFCNTAPVLGVEGEAASPSSPYPSSINVAGLTGVVTDVNVRLFVKTIGYPDAADHWPADLDVMVAAPGGTGVVMMSDAGGTNLVASPALDVDLTLDDQAGNALPGDTTLSTGTFRPTDDDDDVDELVPADVWHAPAPAPGGASLSAFNGLSPNGTWSLYALDDYAGSGRVNLDGGWCVDILTTAAAPVAPPADFDGDGLSDIAVFRPGAGKWYVHGDPTPLSFGAAGDIPVAADYNADGTTDVAVFRPSSGKWYSLGAPTPLSFGTTGDKPVPDRYDADPAVDRAVWRPSNGQWYVEGALSPVQHGTTGDVPVPGQWDADPAIDFAVFRPSNGRWYVHGGGAPVQFGITGDIPVPGQWDGDPATDIAVYRPSNGRWYIHDGGSISFGTTGDIPVPAQWDADPLTDLAVYRPSLGRWYVAGVEGFVQFGTMGDIPVAKHPAR
jgi:hypothetical protein